MAIRYELNGGGGTDSDCTPSLGNNEQALATRDESTAITRVVPFATTDEESMSWTTLVNNPNSGDWPSGSYDLSVNLSVVGANLTIRGQLYRLNSSCTIQGAALADDTTGVTIAGIYTFSNTTDPAAGAAGDRFQLRLLASNGHASMTRSFTVTLDGDSWIQGPWPAERTLTDTVYPVSETTLQKADIFRLFTEVLDLSDTESEQVIAGLTIVDRQLSEQLDMSDARASTLLKAITDALDMSDATSLSSLKTLVESQDFSDSLGKVLEKTVSEQADTADERLQTILKLISEAQDVSDAATAQVIGTIVRTLTETLNLSDSVTTQTVGTTVRTPTETQDLADAVSGFRDRVETDVLRYLFRNRVESDTERPLVEALTVFTAGQLIQRTFTDNADMADLFLKELHKAIAEVQDVTDTITTETVRALVQLTLTDAVDVSDAVAKRVEKLITESQDPVVDSVTAARVSEIVRTLTDALDLSDIFVREVAKVITDTEDVADALIKQFLLLVSDAEDSIVDSATATYIRAFVTVSAADSLATSDSFASALFKTIAESQETLDDISRRLSKSIAENLSVEDVATVARVLIQTASERQDVADILALALTKTLADNPDFNEELRKDFFKVLAEPLDLSDTNTRSITQEGITTILDTADVSDAFIKTIIKTIAETQVHSDSVSTSIVLYAVPFIEAMLTNITDRQSMQTGTRDMMSALTSIKGTRR